MVLGTYIAQLRSAMGSWEFSLSFSLRLAGGRVYLCELGSCVISRRMVEWRACGTERQGTKGRVSGQSSAIF